VLGRLEEARVAKVIGSSLEARVVFSLPADGEMLPLLRSYANDLRYLFIVSQVELRESTEPYEKNLPLKIERAEGEKCERCWNYSTRVGESARYPTACERCVEALAEIEGGAA
jgi:isoleucyl-tRNA synthetase